LFEIRQGEHIGFYANGKNTKEGIILRFENNENDINMH
jgi:hypothetical protein